MNIGRMAYAHAYTVVINSLGLGGKAMLSKLFICIDISNQGYYTIEYQRQIHESREIVFALVKHCSAIHIDALPRYEAAIFRGQE